MKKTTFPVKKTFSQDFLNKKWNTLFTITYNQATINEYYEFLNKSPKEQTQEIYEIIIKQIKFSLKDRILKFFLKNYITKIEKWINFEEVIWSIFANRFRTYTSIFNWLRKTWKWWSKWSIDSVWLSAICKEYNISPTDLMQNYTLEQYFWFLDWIEWQNNSLTKEWEYINNEAIKDKEAIKNRAEETKKAFDKLRKK